jgi:hypothetical protein
MGVEVTFGAPIQWQVHDFRMIRRTNSSTRSPDAVCACTRFALLLYSSSFTPAERLARLDRARTQQ